VPGAQRVEAVLVLVLLLRARGAPQARPGAQPLRGCWAAGFLACSSDTNSSASHSEGHFARQPVREQDSGERGPSLDRRVPGAPRRQQGSRDHGSSPGSGCVPSARAQPNAWASSPWPLPAPAGPTQRSFQAGGQQGRRDSWHRVRHRPTHRRTHGDAPTSRQQPRPPWQGPGSPGGVPQAAG